MLTQSTLQLAPDYYCDCIRITNTSGAYIEVLTHGGILKSIYVPNHEGILENVVLEYQNPTDYYKNPGYLNALIGRTAGRLHNGQITLEDKVYPLTKNDGAHTLHGGDTAISHKNWHILETTSHSVTLSTQCAHLEDGYPGQVAINVCYTFSDDNALTIHYEGSTDHLTLMNLTNHAYFNLSGNAKQEIHNHVLQIKSNAVHALRPGNIPSGEWLPVKQHDAFDFTTEKPIGQCIDTPHPQLIASRGYDHPWELLEGTDCVTLVDPSSHRKLVVTTDQPVVVVYAMNYENPCLFTNGLENIRRYGVCFETQAMPIGLNECYKKDSLLYPNQRYEQTTVFKFDVY